MSKSNSTEETETSDDEYLCGSLHEAASFVKHFQLPIKSFIR